MAPKLETLPTSYPKLIASLKDRIQKAQIKAALSVHQELIKLYWDIGKVIVERQKEEKWGSKVIDRIGIDLQNEFPGIEGFSRRNIYRMKAFYLAYQIVPQPVALLETLPIFRIPWGHNAVLLDKLKI